MGGQSMDEFIKRCGGESMMSSRGVVVNGITIGPTDIKYEHYEDSTPTRPPITFSPHHTNLPFFHTINLM